MTRAPGATTHPSVVEKVTTANAWFGRLGRRGTEDGPQRFMPSRSLEQEFKMACAQEEAQGVSRRGTADG